MDSNCFQVPWYSMEEWNVVYGLVYSNNMEDMKKAYRRLLVWKARVENLPAGVECTLGILQVRLRELELSNSKESILSHEDLQLMYSTAIIRFLNMIAELEQGRGQGGASTLYYKAQAMAIPPWIVNLRHDAAHSSQLPALHSLKAAANFIFTWLNDYYWKNEAEHTHDYYSDLPPASEVYKRNIRNIFSLLEIYLTLASSTSQSVSSDTAESLSKLLPNIDTRDKDECISKILNGMSKKLNKESQKHDILTLIVEETDFLNGPTVKTPSRAHLHRTWAPLLTILNKHHLGLDLMRLLVQGLAGDEEQKGAQAAQWVDDICKGFIKLERCLHVKLDLVKRRIGLELSAKQQFALVLKVADSTYSKLRSAMVLKGTLPHQAEFKEVLEEALRWPSQHTMVFLDSLCFLSHVPKPPLAQLVNLYLNKSLKGSHSDSSHLTSVFTVDSLPRLPGESSQDASRTCSDVDMQEGSTNIWSLAEDLDWLHCPLGSFPGESEDIFLDSQLLEA